jgi:outer membrane protein assembly factor BamB
VKDRIYLTGDVEEELLIFALNERGRKVWETGNGRSWRTPYPGARAACTYSEGRLYHLNAHGRLACLDAETGDEIWSFNVLERFGGKNITWALSECVLVDGPRVIVTPGGTRALMAALDKQTGETVWMTEPLHLGPSPSPDHQRLAAPAGEADKASYTSPILLKAKGRRVLVSCSLRHAFAVDAESGVLLWTRPLKTRHGVIAATPVLVDDAVFVTAPDTDTGGLLLRLGAVSANRAVEDLWATPLDTCHGGLVRIGDSLVGSWYRRQKGWACVDVASGQVRYSMEDLAKGSVLYADERFYVLSEEGEMALLQARSGEFELTGRFPLVEGRVRDAWTHPVILGGRLYLRYHETLYCYDIGGS